MGSSRSSTGASVQERTGDGEPLALATGETASVFADEGVEPVGKRVGPRVEAYAGECTPEVGVRSVRSGDEEIGADAGVEDVGVLAGERERRAHVLLPVVAGVVAGDRHPASFRVEEPQQQGRDRRLARSARPDQGDVPAGSQDEVDAAEGGLVSAAVARGHVLQRDSRPPRRPRDRVARFVDRGLAADQLEDATARRCVLP